MTDLVILNSLSKNHDQYKSNLVQVSAIKQLAEEDLELMAGQSVSYVITNYRSKVQSERVRPTELLDSQTGYDAARYIELLLRGASAILQPFEVDEEALKDAVEERGVQTRLPQPELLPEPVGTKEVAPVPVPKVVVAPANSSRQLALAAIRSAETVGAPL